MTDLQSASRRSVLGAAVMSAAGCVLAFRLASPAAAQQKTAKADARYQDHPNGGAHCEVCAYYQPPVACRVVRGEVSPNGWCGFFQAKTG